MFTIASIVSAAGTWNLNGAGQHICFAPDQPVVPYTAEVATRARRHRTPLRESVTITDRTFPLFFSPGPGLTATALRQLLYKHMAPALTSQRYLYATNDDASAVPMQLLFDVVSLQQYEDGSGNHWVALCRAVDPYWEAQATTAVSGSVTNGGDLPAYPSYTLTPSGASVRRVRVTWTDRTGRGLANYLVRNVFDSTGLSATAASNYEVFYQGRSIPFFVVSPNNASTKVFCRIDLPPSGTAYVDIYYGSAVSNTTTSNQLDPGQLDLTTTTDTHLVFNQAWVSTAPAGATNVWVPARTGKSVANTSYGYYLEEAARVIFEIAASGKDNDVDSITLVSGVPAASGTALALQGWIGATSVTNEVQTVTRPDGYTPAGQFRLAYFFGVDKQTTYDLGADASAADVQAALQALPYVGSGGCSVAKTTVGATGARWTITYTGTAAGRDISQVYAEDGTTPTGIPFQWGTTTEGSAAQIRAYVRKRLANQLNWTDCWTSTTGGTVNTTIDVSGAVQLAIGVEPLVEEATGTWQISFGGGILTLDLDSSQTPAASVAAAVTAYYYSSLIVTNSTTGQSITLGRLYLDNDPLIVDCTNLQVRPTTAGLPVYCATPTFTDPDGWLPLNAGANTLVTTGTTPASITLGGTFRARYVA